MSFDMSLPAVEPGNNGVIRFSPHHFLFHSSSHPSSASYSYSLRHLEASNSTTLNPDLSPLIVGRFGFSIYSLLFLVTLYRLMRHLCLGQERRVTLRKAFHFVLLVYTILEMLSYIPMAFGGDDR